MVNNQEEAAFRPPHPGEYLREDVLPELGMSITKFAEHLGISRNSASKLINEKQDVSVEMAIRLGQAFKNGARFWMALQMQRDLWDAEHGSRINVKPLTYHQSDDCAA